MINIWINKEVIEYGYCTLTISIYHTFSILSNDNLNNHLWYSAGFCFIYIMYSSNDISLSPVKSISRKNRWKMKWSYILQKKNYFWYDRQIENHKFSVAFSYAIVLINKSWQTFSDKSKYVIVFSSHKNYVAVWGPCVCVWEISIKYSGLNGLIDFY